LDKRIELKLRVPSTKALLSISGVSNKNITLGLPYPYCVADGYLRGVTEEDKAKGFESLIYFPDGFGFLNTIKQTEDGFEVSIEEMAEAHIENGILHMPYTFD